MLTITYSTAAVLSVHLGQVLADEAEVLTLCEHALQRPVSADELPDVLSEAQPTVRALVPWLKEISLERVTPTPDWLGLMDALHGDWQIVALGDGAEPASTRYSLPQP
jgi:hypothetical protein